MPDMQTEHPKEEEHTSYSFEKNHSLQGDGSVHVDHGDNAEGVIRVQTSGSTGAPKSVARSLRSWELSAQAEAALFGIGAQQRFAVIGSPNHSLWTYVSYRARLAGGDFLGLELGQRSARAILNDLRVFTPTVLYAVPDLLERLLSAGLTQVGLAKANLPQAEPSRAGIPEASAAMGRGPILPCLQTLILGGGAWSPKMKDGIDAFAPQAKTWLFYGTAEASFIGYSSTTDWPWYRPFPGVEVRVAAETGQLSVCSAFACLAPKSGELWESIGASDTPQLLADGNIERHQEDQWLTTSDCVEMNVAKNDLRFRLIGRMERLIRLNGVDIAPEPIEDFLAMHFLGSLFYVWLADHVGCARLGLFYCSDVELTDTARIRGLVREAFPGLPVLSIIRRIGSWPRLANGKTDFQRLGGLARGLT